MNPPGKTFEQMVDFLAQDDYSRERLQPQPTDTLYLHLSDLREALKAVQTTEPVKLLDYGCGSSPYRALFPNASYKRADFLTFEGLDYQLTGDSRVPEVDAQFDFVLSTQVLEHVSEPGVYLSECFRLLKPGGKLFLTTHGTYEDHGCPYDFQRWTADGLKLLLDRTGFQNVRIQKLTTGPRAILFLMGNSVHQFTVQPMSATRIVLSLYRRFFYRFRSNIHTAFDRYFSQHRVADSTEPGHPFYICLAVHAEKPL